MASCCGRALRRRFKVFTFCFILAGVFSGAARAEPKPYAAAGATFARALGEDASLRVELQRLRGVIEARDMAALDAALADDFTLLTCGTDPTRPCAPGAKGAVATRGKTPGARLRAGLCCGDMPKKDITEAVRVETVLGLVGALLAEESIGAGPTLPGAACLPAPPTYDFAAAAAIARAADVEPGNLRVTSGESVLRLRAAADAPEAARLPAGRIAPLATLGQESLAPGWIAIALPQGGLGFTRDLVFDELATPALCLAKDAGGTWKIRLIVQRKDDAQ
jgi:hypothetical protein